MRKKLRKLTLLLCLGILQSLIVSCATVPDVPICTEITPTRGFCTWTVSDKEQIVDDTSKLNGMSWWDMRPAFVLVPPTSWVGIKTAFIKLCKQNNNCNVDIDLWERKFDEIKK